MLFSADSASSPTSSKNIDFNNFAAMTNLIENGPRSDGGELSNTVLARLAARELMTSGMSPRELYLKIDTLLKTLRPHLTRMMSIQKTVNLDSSNPNMKCIEVGFCFGFVWGLGFKLSLGLIRSARYTFPVVGVKLRFLNKSVRGDDPVFGAALEFGSEQKENANLKALDFVEIDSTTVDADVANAVIFGKYHTDISETHKSKGMLLGLYRDAGQVNHVGFRLPIKIPIYVYRFEKEFEFLLLKMMRALQTFDFESYAAIFEKLKITISRVEKELKERGISEFDSLDNDTLIAEHPMASPGMLFHPRTLLRYALDLAPEQLKLEGCDAALLGDGKKGNKAAKLLLLGSS